MLRENQTWTKRAVQLPCHVPETSMNAQPYRVWGDPDLQRWPRIDCPIRGLGTHTSPPGSLMNSTLSSRPSLQ
jgi:hypothetical protein